MANGERVVVTGASGIIGRRLCLTLQQRGYAAVVFSRSPEAARRKVPGAAEYLAWDGGEHGDWEQALEGAYGVVHLAGASLFGTRWTDEYKKEIYDSRIMSTRNLVRAMAAAERKPQVFVSGSAVGYYGARDDSKLDESAKPGSDFLARLCVDWEAEALKAGDLGVRTVVVRTGIVLDPDEGALPQLMLPFKLFAGGYILPGTQWFPWIHIDDEVGLLLLALENEQVRGPLNAMAPNPLTNKEFCGTLGRVMGRPSWMPVPGFGLSLALGEFGESLTKGQRAVPARALELGYSFMYPTAQQALSNLIRRS